MPMTISKVEGPESAAGPGPGDAEAPIMIGAKDRWGDSQIQDDDRK